MLDEKDKDIVISCPEKDASGEVKAKKFGYREIRGMRPAQEDALVWFSLTEEELGSLSPEDIGHRLWTAYALLDEAFLKENDYSGTTASTTVYDGKEHFITATLGDAAAFAVAYDAQGNPLGVIQLNSVIHKPDNKLESERINSKGGYVLHNRVNGQLAVSRAIGDRAFKTCVPSEATIDITSIDKIAADLKINRQQIGSIQIITSCDGFTEAADRLKMGHADYLLGVLENTIAPGKLEELSLALHLIQAAFDNGSTDNISVAVQTIQAGSGFGKGVYDGHGGNQAAHFVANNICDMFKEQCELTEESYNEQSLSVTKQHLSYLRDNNPNTIRETNDTLIAVSKDNIRQLEEEALRKEEEQRRQLEEELRLQEEQRRQQREEELRQQTEQEKRQEAQNRLTAYCQKKEKQADNAFGLILIVLNNLATDMLDRDEKLAYAAADQLNRSVEREWKQYLARYRSDSNAYQTFLDQCDEHFKKAHEVLDIHRDWYEFLINLLAAISVVGLLIKEIVNYRNNNSFFFVYNTKSHLILNEAKECLSDLPNLANNLVACVT